MASHAFTRHAVRLHLLLLLLLSAPLAACQHRNAQAGAATPIAQPTPNRTMDAVIRGIITVTVPATAAPSPVRAEPLQTSRRTTPGPARSLHGQLAVSTPTVAALPSPTPTRAAANRAQPTVPSPPGTTVPASTKPAAQPTATRAAASTQLAPPTPGQGAIPLTPARLPGGPRWDGR